MIVNVNVEFDYKSLYNKYNKALKLGGPIQKSLDSKIIKDIAPYVPMRDGDLSESVKDSKIGSGKLTWSTPYAGFVYYGKTKDGKDLNYSKIPHPLAGPYWTERYKSNHIEELKQMIVQRVTRL